jgi:hypothetical protein
VLLSGKNQSGAKREEMRTEGRMVKGILIVSQPAQVFKAHIEDISMRITHL